jgi:predicted nucleotidyltransferase
MTIRSTCPEDCHPGVRLARHLRVDLGVAECFGALVASLIAGRWSRREASVASITSPGGSWGEACGAPRAIRKRVASWPYALHVTTLENARLSVADRHVIERWIDRLRVDIDLDAVWLFGSRARGEEGGEDSDVDLLVITRGEPERDRARVWQVIDEVARELGVNPATYIPHTWDRRWLESRRAIDSFFVQELDRDKIVLFGTP